MDISKDYYKILGVDENATDKEIQSKFRKLSKETHPDLHPGDKEAEAKFKEYSEAYDILSNKQKREEYDNMRRYGSQRFNNEDDLFSEFMRMHGFGNARRSNSNAPRDGDDIVVNCVINFAEFAFGSEKEVSVDIKKNCHHCHGTGSKDGKKTKCPVCGGTGMEVNIFNNGFSREMTICRRCMGAGVINTNTCPHCHNGKNTDTVKVKINIPKYKFGLLKTSIAGNEGTNGGRCGDVYVKVSVNNDSPFEIDDRLNLYTDIYINPFEAIIGTEKEVVTPHGMAKVKIPSGSQYGQQLRVAGKGLNGSDLYLRIVIEIPRGLSDKERKNLEEIYKKLHKFNYKKSEEANKIFKEYNKKLEEYR